MELHYKAEIWVAMKFPDDVTKEEIRNIILNYEKSI